MVRGSTGTLEEIFFKTSRFDVSFCTNCFLMGSSIAVVFCSYSFFWVYNSAVGVLAAAWL